VELRLRYRSEQEICATWGPVVIRICDGAPTHVEDLHRVTKVFDELLETHPNIAMLLVTTHGTALPDGETQRYAKHSLLRYEERLIIVAALLGLGFWASALRAAIAGVMRVLRHENLWMENSVETAISRVTMELIGLDGEALLAAYEQLWAELQRPAPARSTG
jgi:hypothetical protein